MDFFLRRPARTAPAMQWFFTLVLLRFSPYSRSTLLHRIAGVLERHRIEEESYLAQTFYRYGENNAAYERHHGYYSP